MTFDERLAEFIARKSDPKWKAPKPPRPRSLRKLTPEQRARIEREWNEQAAELWERRGVQVSA